MSVVIGLVVEGKDDFDVIESLAKSELSMLGIGNVSFRRLQPDRDATGEVERGGWTKVVGWLMAHAGAMLETYFVPLFDGSPACDYIIVHIDADVYKECLPRANIAVPLDEPKVLDLVNLIRSAIERWLTPSENRKKSLAYAIPVYKTENWIMAAVPECPDPVWSTSDAKSARRSLFDSSKHRSVRDMRSTFIRRAASDQARTVHRAASFQIFANDLSKWA